MTIIPKKVSNYELFFDLVFVFALSQMTGMLHGEGSDHLSLTSYLQLILAFVMLFKLWIHETIYLNKYGERDLLDIITIVTNMFLIGYMAKYLSLSWEKTIVNFQLLYILSHLTMIGQYVLRGRRMAGLTASMKAHIGMIVIDLGVNALMLSGFLLIPHGYSMVFGVGLYGVSLFFPLYGRQLRQGDKVNFPHLVERMQLLTIVFFGESLIAAIKSLDLLSQFVPAVLIFLTIGMLFMAYIAQTALFINHHQSRAGLGLYISHIMILLGILNLTICLELVGDSHHFHDALKLALLSLPFFYLGVNSLVIYNKSGLSLTKRFVVWYSLELLLGLLLMTYLAHDLLSLISLLFLTAFGHTVIAWFRFPDEFPEN